MHLMERIRGIAHLICNWIFFNDKIIFYQLHQDKIPPSSLSIVDVNCRSLSESELTLLSNIDAPLFISHIQDLYRSGYCVYGGFLNGELIFRALAIKGKVTCNTMHGSCPFEFDKDEAWITYCVTKEEFRGKGVYPEMLRQINHDLFSNGKITKVYISVIGENVASVRGLLKVGFKPYAVARRTKILGIGVGGVFHKIANVTDKIRDS